jgi:hypothetical protein
MMALSTTTLATDGRFKRSVYSVSVTNARKLRFTTIGWLHFLFVVLLPFYSRSNRVLQG